ncbi:MAG: serine protease [Candidatus Uhrbacteria bacterium]
MKYRLSSLIVFGALLLTAQQAHAQSTASVLVACDHEQGSGTVINGSEGYVLTAGHVVISDLGAGQIASSCVVYFSDENGNPSNEYRASIIRAVYNDKLSQDFAILKIGASVGPDRLNRPFPYLATNEFSSKGDGVRVIGYPGPDHVLKTTTGKITDYVGGFIDATAEIFRGDSGGTAVDDLGRLIGVPTRILTMYVGTSTESSQISYQLVDIRAVMNWLDTFGINEHDQYFTHADHDRYHQSAVYITQQNLGCLDLARTRSSSAVYCLMADDTRLAFPTDTAFYSWFSDFKDVVLASNESIASYRLVRNVTYKPGTLVKVRTASPVYVVVDSFGSLRQIPSEQKAIDLWGPAWAGLVFDVPDEFWVNYRIGQPLE